MESTKLKDVVTIQYVTPDNAVFSEKEGFLSLKFKTAEGEEKDYPRVKLQRNFPNETPEQYVSVLDKEDEEIAVIRDVGELGEATAEMIRRELARRYFVFKIEKILSVNQKFGYSQWRVLTDAGEMEFTVRDTYRNFRKTGGDRAAVSDVDGNRYEIPSLSGLDRPSMKKIELYI